MTSKIKRYAALTVCTVAAVACAYGIFDNRADVLPYALGYVAGLISTLLIVG